MLLNKINHIGVAVKSIEAALPFYKAMGADVNHIEEVPSQKVKTAFIKVGETTIELVEATSPESPIAKFIEKNGGRGGVHHVAFAVEGLQGQLDEAAAMGIQLIDKQPRKGAEGLNIAFLHPKSTFGVLTELCENPNK